MAFVRVAADPDRDGGPAGSTEVEEAIRVGVGGFVAFRRRTAHAIVGREIILDEREVWCRKEEVVVEGGDLCGLRAAQRVLRWLHLRRRRIS